MEKSVERQEGVQRQFDSFCKKVLAYEKKTWLYRRAQLMKREVPLSELTEQQTAHLCTEDVYPSEHFHFEAQGHDVLIDDVHLAAILEEMSEQNRTPLLLSCGVEMKDTEIARELNIPRSTVSYRRNVSVSALRKIMADSDADHASGGGESGNVPCDMDGDGNDRVEERQRGENDYDEGEAQ